MRYFMALVKKYEIKMTSTEMVLSTCRLKMRDFSTLWNGPSNNSKQIK